MTGGRPIPLTFITIPIRQAAISGLRRIRPAAAANDGAPPLPKRASMATPSKLPIGTITATATAAAPKPRRPCTAKATDRPIYVFMRVAPWNREAKAGPLVASAGLKPSRRAVMISSATAITPAMGPTSNPLRSADARVEMSSAGSRTV